MSDFDRATAVALLSEGKYRVRVPDGWQQGRGAFGGLVLGTLARAMVASEPDPTRRLRTLTGDLCGPALPGDAVVQVSTLRRGKNVSNLDARLLAGDEIVARASAVFAGSRSLDVTHIDPPPHDREAAIVWRLVPPLEMSAFAPVFAQHYEYRSLDLPFQGGDTPRARGFIRLRVPGAAVDEVTLIGLLDAWWPALFTIEKKPRPIATVSFTAEIVCDPSDLRPDEPLYFSGRVVAERAGFFVEFRELYRGESLVALNQQTFAILA